MARVALLVVNAGSPPWPTRVPLRHLVREPGPRLTKVAVGLLRPGMRLISRHAWSGLANIPSGGAVLAVNHVSNFDPLVMSHVVVHAGRWPYFLAKSSLFDNPVLGPIVRATGQIPVHRGTAQAESALTAARAAINSGQLIIVYPEGTITADPDGWPMTALSGAARLALETGCPLVPAGQWGAQAILGMKAIRAPRLVPRPTISVHIGPSIELDDLRGRPITTQVLNAATDRLMTAIVEIVADLRGESPPAALFDYAAWKREKDAPARGGGTRRRKSR